MTCQSILRTTFRKAFPTPSRVTPRVLVFGEVGALLYELSTIDALTPAHIPIYSVRFAMSKAPIALSSRVFTSLHDANAHIQLVEPLNA
jgi:hypothetical protein